MFKKRIVELYSRIMPSSKKQINDKISEIDKTLNKSTQAILQCVNNLERIQKSTEEKVNENISLEKKLREEIHVEIETQFIKILKDELVQSEEKMSCVLEDAENKIVQRVLESAEIKSINREVTSLHEEINFLKRQLHLMDLQEKKIHRATNESVWAEVFHDAIVDSSWLKKKTFYPGRWAAGYPFLYALYRCLNEMRPNSILELGLGQTTRVIGQYAEANQCEHIVTEHDAEWIKLFKKEFTLSHNTDIMQLNIKKEIYAGEYEVTVYDNFAEAMQGKKFDLISIDAPFGGATLEYSRVDILQILPQCLNPSFVILLDDYDRKGEKHMIEQLKHILEENNIAYEIGLYWGNKDLLMIASADMKFLCTM